MTLDEIRDYFETNYTDVSLFEQVSIGKIDNNLDNALCFYNSKRNVAYVNTLNVSTYTLKPITILMRNGKNQAIAERNIMGIHKFFDRRKTVINKRNVLFKLLYENPITLGTDANGIIEYSLEIDVMIEKEES